MSLKVHVKWGKEKFQDIELNTDESPEIFQAQLFALSNVPPERQKIMAKGMTLKSESWIGFPVKNGLTLLMMGSADALPQAPDQKTQFIEDMSDSQLATATNLPAGLNNLGNTCYMNATVQCLKNVPELKQGLSQYEGRLGVGSIMTNPSEAITVSLRDLYKMMDKTSDGLPPIVFLQVLHAVFPHFAEKTDQGVFQQQDANECWTQIIRMLQQKLPAVKNNTEEQPTASASSTSSLIDQYFGIESKTTMKCDEAPDEAEIVSSERQYQLSCYISQEVKYLHTGLRSRLKDTITKASPSLGKDASYTKTQLISRLPSYLTIQFVRFFYKEKEKVNAKILKDIKFPMELDVYELCSPELQAKLEPMRKRFKEEDDKKIEQKIKLVGKQKEETMDVDKKTKTLPYFFEDDVGSNNSGMYELTAVLTHRGRSSSSGHYVGWVKQKGDDWLMCDDDNVVPVTSQDILKLSGGGDWHCAYVLLYAPKQLTIEEL